MRDRSTNKGIKLMRQLNVRMLFVCLAALLLVIACADTSKKQAETSTETTETPSQTTEETTETPSQTAASIEEVTLAVTGMT